MLPIIGVLILGVILVAGAIANAQLFVIAGIKLF